MIKLFLLILVIVSQTSRCLATGQTATTIRRDIIESICGFSYLQVALAYQRYCANDGFNFCNERRHSTSYLAENASLDCDTTCSGETGLVVEWNTHLLSGNYNITISCQNDSCTSKNEETKLLNLEQDFTMDNYTLQFQPHLLYQDSLIGCIATADNCTAYRYWYISFEDLGASDVSVFVPINNTVYYTALGDNLVVSCEAYGDSKGSLTWYKGETSVRQFTQLCVDFNITDSLCIQPPYTSYIRERVRSRTRQEQGCVSEVEIFSYLDISVTNWTDSGLPYRCTPRATDNSIEEEAYLIYVVVDVVPEFIHLPASYAVQNAMSSYSCVAKAGYGAKLQWFNANGHVVPEYSSNDTSSPSVYVTYSMDNVLTVLTGKDSIYTGDPIDSVYPVHNATLHINGTPYHDQSRSFFCVITGVNEQFLQQYNVSDDDLLYIMTVYINASSSPATNVFSGGSIVGIIVSVILILAVML